MESFGKKNRLKRKANVGFQNEGSLTNNQQQHNGTFNALIIDSGSSTSTSGAQNSFKFNNNDYIDELKKRNYFESLPPGFRFRPVDSELIVHYLNKKVRLEKLPPNKIQDVILYNYTPEELIANHPIQGEKEWFFFTPRDRKYKNGKRPNRAAGDGYWKATGTDKPIIDDGNTVGFRKALVYYRGKHQKGKKTNWIMHEFRVNKPPRSRSGEYDMRLDDCVLCRVYYKEEKAKTTQDGDEEDIGEPNGNLKQNCPLALENQVLEETHCDYNGIIGDLDGLMNTTHNFGQIQPQNGPHQEINPFSAPISTTTNFSDPPLEPMSSTSNYGAVSMLSYRPPPFGFTVKSTNCALPFQPLSSTNHGALSILSHRPPSFGAPPITPRILSAQPFHPMSSDSCAHRPPPPPPPPPPPAAATTTIHPTVVQFEFMKKDPRELLFLKDIWGITDFENFALESEVEFLDNNFMGYLDSVFPNNTLPEHNPK